MAPNWFIAFPMQVEGFRLPPAPTRVRIFARSDLHITLGFLGAVQESEARRAWEVAVGVGCLRGVRGTFDRIEALGHPRKPSAIAAMVAEGREALVEMIGESRGPALAAAGARPDSRPPLPHMTLARIQRRADAAERRAARRWAELLDLGRASFATSSLALYTWSAERQERLFQIVAEHALTA